MSDDLRADLVVLIPRLRRFAYALTGSLDEGDDVVQTACLKALDRLDQFEHGTRFDSWMFRIVQNSFIDTTRSRWRKTTTADPELIALASDDGADAAASERRLHLADVRKAVAELPDDQRSVLGLVAIEGRTYKEAADILGLPIGTVMSRLARARAKLAPLNEGAAS